jgi:pectate lyase
MKGPQEPNLGEFPPLTVSPGIGSFAFTGNVPLTIGQEVGDYEDILADQVGFATLYNGGAGVTGGAGQELVIVENLNDSGTGSLREALSSGNRWIRFAQDLGGTINLQSVLQVNNVSNITIDGRGANITVNADAGPSPSGGGIHFARSGTSNNIILLYMKFTDSSGAANDIMRFGRYSGTSTAIVCEGVWIYHCDFVGPNGDELLDLNPQTQNFTIGKCYFHHPTGRGNLVDRVQPPRTLARYSGIPAFQVTYHNNWWDRVQRRCGYGRHGRFHHFNNVHFNWNNDCESGFSAGSTPTDMGVYSERNCGDTTSGASNKYIARWFDSDDSAGMNIKDGGGHLLVNSSLGVLERNPSSVFIPSTFYSYTAQTMNAAYRTTVEANAGWQNVPFPGD